MVRCEAKNEEKSKEQGLKKDFSVKYSLFSKIICNFADYYQLVSYGKDK